MWYWHVISTQNTKRLIRKTRRREPRNYKDSWELKSSTVDFRPAQNCGSCPAWASEVGMKEKKFCERSWSEHLGNNPETWLLQLNVSKRWAYHKTCCVLPLPPQRLPSRNANTVLRGTKIHCRWLLPSTVHIKIDPWTREKMYLNEMLLLCWIAGNFAFFIKR